MINFNTKLVSQKIDPPTIKAGNSTNILNKTATFLNNVQNKGITFAANHKKGLIAGASLVALYAIAYTSKNNLFHPDPEPIERDRSNDLVVSNEEERIFHATHCIPTTKETSPMPKRKSFLEKLSKLFNSRICIPSDRKTSPIEEFSLEKLSKLKYGICDEGIRIHKEVTIPSIINEIFDNSVEYFEKRGVIREGKYFLDRTYEAIFNKYTISIITVVIVVEKIMKKIEEFCNWNFNLNIE